MYCLLLITLLALFYDIKSYTIKNNLIVVGIISGICINFYQVGFKGIYSYIIALLLPTIIFIPLFLLKALGAGDIKLFSVIGCYLGIFAVIKVIIYSFLIGGIISVIYLIKSKSFSKRLNHLQSYISNIKEINQDSLTNNKLKYNNIKVLPYHEKEKHGREGVIHFTIAIFLALLVFTFTN